MTAINRKFVTDIPGRVKKVQSKNFLLALFEAITNSIQSQEFAGNKNQIEVQIVRDSAQQDLDVGEERTISGFIITDKGVGFNDENMDSFCLTDSSYKEKIGGKGVGRFSWLKFFEHIEVESAFLGLNQKDKFLRKFTFDVNGISKEVSEPTKGDFETTIRLLNLNAKFSNKSRKTLEEVCEQLIEHFISYFVTGGCPNIIVKDGIKSRSVNELYENSIGKNKITKKIQIKDKSFNLTGIKFYHAKEAHSLFLCANQRAAEKISFGAFNSFLANKFHDETLKQYAFHVYAESDYLDEIVNDDREGFRYPDQNSLDLYDGGITRKEIVEAILPFVLENLGPQIESKKKENLDNVKSFISSQAPQYSYLLKEKAADIMTIGKTEPADVDLELRKLQFEYETQTRIEATNVFKLIASSTKVDTEFIEKKTSELLSRLNDSGKANLSQYILQRKLILEVLKKRLEVVDEVRAREEAVHSLIFPLQSTSEEITYEKQNLWIIDERLSYHYYLASDKPLNTIPPAESESRKEPDIIVFNRPIALNDREIGSGKFESIVIVEFKRPGELQVSGQKNPYSQVIDYISKIKEGHERSYNGRLIEVSKETSFYCYIVCDLEENVKKFFQKEYDMKLTPDGRGLYKFHDAFNAYVEVISYNKMLDDAVKRNRILFEKLNIN